MATLGGRLISAGLWFTLVACAAAPGSPERLTRTVRNTEERGSALVFSLHPGDEVALSDTDWLRLAQVLEDSRCPVNAQCLWAGRVVLEGSVEEGGKVQNFILGTLAGMQDAPDEVQVGVYRIQIVEVEPYPETIAGIAQADYVISLRVEDDAQKEP